MTEEQVKLLQLAKQGNPQAIAGLINRSLKPKGIAADDSYPAQSHS